MKAEKFTAVSVYLLSAVLFVLGTVAFFAGEDFKTLLLVQDNDHFFTLFKRVQDFGMYAENVRGTSVLYNIIMQGMVGLVGDTETAFLAFNGFCMIYILVFSILILYRYTRTPLYFVPLAVIFFVYYISQKNSVTTYDDNLQGSIYITMIYFLLKFRESGKTNFLVLSGVLLGLAFSTRPLAVFYLPVLLIFIWYLRGDIKNNLLHLFLPCLLIVATLHLPSLVEKQKLSYYDKNPPGYSWMQRNYLGIKKMNEGKLKIEPWSIWRGTSWDEVKAHLAKNGENSLPKSYSEAIKKSPELFGKAWLYNLAVTVKHYFYIAGLLLFLPLYSLIFRSKNKRSGAMEYLMFITFSVIVTFAAYSFVEFRWFLGTEILLFLAIGFASNLIAERRKKLLLNSTYILSLLILIFHYSRYFL